MSSSVAPPSPAVPSSFPPAERDVDLHRAALPRSTLVAPPAERGATLRCDAALHLAAHPRRNLVVAPAERNDDRRAALRNCTPVIAEAEPDGAWHRSTEHFSRYGDLWGSRTVSGAPRRAALDRVGHLQLNRLRVALPSVALVAPDNRKGAASSGNENQDRRYGGGGVEKIEVEGGRHGERGGRRSGRIG